MVVDLVLRQIGVSLILPTNDKLHLIILAEDHPDDVFLMRLALQKADLATLLFVARDGQEAVDYLAGQGPYADRKSYPFPSLLLLDLKMPRMNGFEVLAWLQDRSELNGFPTVVLSGSDLEEDVRKANELGADDYRVKPTGVENMVKMLQELHTMWLDGHNNSAPKGNGS
jgi:CheY-like chemotaxis protein